MLTSTTIAALVDVANELAPRAEGAWTAADTLKCVVLTAVLDGDERRQFVVAVPGDREVDLKRLEAWEVAQMFGVPTSKLGINLGQSNTYQNLEADNAAFVQDSLLPVARKFEAAIDALLPYGTSLKIDFRQILRGDTTEKIVGAQPIAEFARVLDKLGS